MAAYKGFVGKALQECKIVQKNRTVESGSEGGQAGRISFCGELI